MAKARHALCWIYFCWSSKLNRKVLIMRRGWFFSDPYVFCWYEMCQCSMWNVNTQAGPMLVPQVGPRALWHKGLFRASYDGYWCPWFSVSNSATIIYLTMYERWLVNGDGSLLTLTFLCREMVKFQMDFMLSKINLTRYVLTHHLSIQYCVE